MSFTLRASLCLLALSLGLVNPALTQSQSVPGPPALSGVNDLAAALVRANSDEEQERLLAQKKEMMNSALLAALKALSDPLVLRGDYAQALKISQLAVRIAERIGDRAGLGNALGDVGWIYARQNRPAEALDRLQKSLAILEEAGDKKGKARALYSIGYTHALQRRFELALEHYDKSLPISEETGSRSLTAQILNGQGLAHSSLGRYDLGLELYQKSRALSEEINDKATLETVLNNIATHYTSHGRYAEALDYLHKSLKIKEELVGSAGDKRSLAIRLQNIGLIYRRQGSLEQALAYARKSLAILEEIDDKFGVASLQNNIGVVYKSQGLYDLSLEWFQKSKQGFEEQKAQGGVARTLNNIGDVYRLQGRHAEALENLQKSLKLREEIKDRGAIPLTLNNLGRLYQDQGNYADMLKVSLRAASLTEEINDPDEHWKARERIGRALRGLGQPVEARRNFLAAITTIESLRHEVGGGGQQQQSFLESRLSPWLGMIALLVSQKEYSEALTFAEQSKARVLVDALQAGRTSLHQSLSQREREAEERERLRLISLNTQLTNELRRDKPDPSRAAELKASVEKARLEYEDFETSLYVAHPELRVQRGEAPIIKAEELAALLPDGASALLEYVVSDDETYLFAVTKAAGKSEAEVRVYTLPVKQDALARQIEAFRAQVAARDLGFRASAIKLYELLVKPAEAQLRGKTNIVIAPDDKLWDLPFQALLIGANRFLIEDAAIAYTPSLTALREMTKRRKNQGENSASTTLLAMGNPLLGTGAANRAALALRDEKLAPLPESEQEVKALRQLYGVSRSKVYIGAEAREDRVKSEAGGARILHFATHGMLNNASPMYSHLMLAEGGANEDGLLEAWELMRLDLKADLAVLSACETARGRIGAGEGMIGLSWAMFIAGVPSTVVSQWKVEAAGTRDLMVNFHRALISQPGAGRATPTKAEALRQAALKLMKNPETRHPFYWAGFVLVGDGR
ncbi:MAG TPA: CHAT domain-containing tetratricopeptide repeat protein [Blastocatellia bacterium]|nr:CHAT domain-containing tetratricopeptide repeat protein [Blastocatellia bacterium]